MKKIENIYNLFMQQICAIYGDELKIIEVLPKMKERATSPEMYDILDRQLEEKKRSLKRLNELSEHFNLNISTSEVVNEAVMCLLREKKSLIDRCNNDMAETVISMYDHAISMHQVNAYKTAVLCATELGDLKAAKLLRKSLKEEKIIERQLEHIKESLVNANSIPLIV